MSLAIGGASARDQVQNPFWVNVCDFGARADGITDNSAAFQAAVDALATKISTLIPNGLRTVGTVFIPAASGTYKLSRPVWVDSSFIEIRGAGQGSRVSCYYNQNHSLFIFGLRRQATVTVNGQTKTLVADASYRPDLFGKLDLTAASGPGIRWGFRSHGDALIQSQVSPLSVGCRSLRQDWTTDNWTETRALTVDFAVEGPNGQMPGFVSVMGIGVASGDAVYPFVVYTDNPNSFVVKFATQDVPFGPQSIRRFSFASGNATGVQRITIQIDLNAATVAAFVNGNQVATSNILGPDWRSGLRFAENDYYPLLIADNGGNRPALGAPNGFDFALYGLLFSRTPRYKTLGAGQAQQRVDGGVIDDLYRYFTRKYSNTGSVIDPGMIGYLSFTENPATHDRVLAVQGGPAANDNIASAYLLHTYISQPGGILDNGIRDVHLIGGHLYGQNIAVGQVLDLAITGVRSTDAYHAVGSLANGANYTVKVEDCVFDATDSGYFGLDQAVWMRNVAFGGAGRATMRFAGCVVNAQNCFVGFWAPNNQSTIKIHSSDYGGNYSFENLIVDYEGDSYGHTAIYCEAHPYASTTSLVLKDIYLGTIGDAALITLRDGLAWFPPAYISVDNLQTYTSKYRAVLDVNSSKWRGEIRGLSVGTGNRIANKIASRVVLRESGYMGPPRINTWAAGAHALEVSLPASGQFSEWRCLSSGTYGTPNPPVWAGLNPLNLDASAFAPYVLNHCFISVVLS